MDKDLVSITTQRVTRSVAKRTIKNDVDEHLPPTKQHKRSLKSDDKPKRAKVKRPVKQTDESDVNGAIKIAKETILNNPPPPFSVEAARAHLVRVDPRFSMLFDKLPCKPFDLEPKESAGISQTLPNAFKSLCCSIIGQQVSALAARAIIYKFIRLFSPELPEKLDPLQSTSAFPFPSAAQVTVMTIEQLRAVGLSQRKAEYITDLATRFTDGRLSDADLIGMDAEKVMAELCAVRGIGRWTVEMFLIFTAKHPDILPCADLAIQKGILRWYTATDPQSSPKKKKSTPLPTPEIKAAIPWKDLPPSPIPIGSSLSLSDLKSRLLKPLKPGLYLTPSEMEQLAEPWKPYRSIPVCYFWSMTDVAPEY